MRRGIEHSSARTELGITATFGAARLRKRWTPCLIEASPPPGGMEGNVDKDEYPLFAGQIRYIQRMEWAGFDCDDELVTVLQQACPMHGGCFEWRDVETVEHKP